MNRYIGGIVNGLLIIAVGVVLLLSNLGYLTIDFWTLLTRFWPLLLVLAGLNIIFFGRSYIGLGMLILIVLVVVWGVNFGLSWGPHGQVQFNGPRITETIDKTVGLSPSSQKGTLRLDMTAGELTIFGGAQSLVEAHFEERNWPAAARPEVTSEGNDVTIKQASNAISTGSVRQKWNIRLNTDLPMAVVANVGAGENNIDLRETKVESLNFSTGASSTSITLGDRVPLCTVTLRAGAASTTVEVPKTAGIKVTVQTGIGSSNLGSLGYNRDGKTYTSANWDTASSKIEITFNGGVGSFELLPR